MGFLDLKRTYIVQDSELEVNGGRYCVSPGPAIPVRIITGEETSQDSIPVPVYVVGYQDIRDQGGDYLLTSEPTKPVSPVHITDEVQGHWAQPVYVVGDDSDFYPTFEFAEAQSVFVAAMAKRNGAAAGPFAAGPLMQGNWAGGGVPDQLTFPRGDLIGNATRFWYDNYDPYQGSVVFWITPEWDGNDGLLHTVFLSCVTGIQYMTKEATNVLRAYFGAGVLDIDVSAWTAGTTYSIVLRWDSKQTLDGTNHLCISIDGAHTFGRTAYTEDGEPEALFHFGGNVAGVNSIDALIEGFTIYRRPLFDGTYGFDVGNGDEIALLAAGADPCLFTGSWDATFCLPTNATVEELVTGPGEAWSHPHNANVVEHGWNEDGGYLSGPYAPVYNATTTSAVVADHANIQDLPAGTFTAEAYIRADSYGELAGGRIFDKTDALAEGWRLELTATIGLSAYITVAGTPAWSACGLDEFTADGKWHLITMMFDGTALPAGNPVISLWVDGIPVASYTSQQAGVGAIVTDVGNDFYIGNNINGTVTFDGAIGWARLSNNLRYTANVGFIAPRQPPAVDGNTVAQWEMTEGTGATLDNATGLAALDATITNHIWEAQWDMELTPLIPRSVEYNATTTSCVVADAARIQNLHDAAMAAEAWVRADSWGEGNLGSIFDKTDVAAEGWRLTSYDAGGLVALVYSPGTSGESWSGADEFVADGKWHHVCMQYDDAGAPRVAYLWIDGVPVASYAAQIPTVGLVVADVGNDLYLGSRSGGTQTFDGSLGGWARISSILRYTNGEAFVPPSRGNPPAPDVNTAWQTDYSDGAGATLTDDSAGANNGTLTNYIWRNTPDLEVDAPGQRVYPWGYVFDVDAANEGYTEVLTGLDAGENYVVRVPIQYERDRRAWPRVRIYDETNAANIVDFDGPKLYGTHTGANGSATLICATGEFPQSLVGCVAYNITDLSLTVATAVSGDKTIITGVLAGGTDNDWDTGDVFMIVPPNENAWVWCEPFCFELPTIARNGAGADCVSISVKVLNRNTEGTLYCHQLECLETLTDEPSMETGAGNPFIVNGWTSDFLDAGDTEAEAGTIHSGAASVEWNPGAILGEGQYSTLTTTIGNFLGIGGWTYGDATDGFRIGMLAPDRGLLQYSAADYQLLTPVTASWRHTVGVWRALNANPRLLIEADAIGGDGFTDDFYAVELDNITLTCTPANQANSAEGTGLRVDGLDTCIQPITDIKATRGRIVFQYTPRHDAADVADFGNLTPVIGTWYGDATNWIMLDWSAVNTIRLQYNCGAGVLVGVWNAAGAIVPGVTYVMEIRYTAGQMQLWINGIVSAITIANNVNFIVIPVNAYWGTDQPGVQQNDFTINEP